MALAVDQGTPYMGGYAGQTIGSVTNGTGKVIVTPPSYIKCDKFEF